MVDTTKRWDGHGGDRYKNVNVPYGYYVFVASCVHVGLILVLNLVRKKTSYRPYFNNTRAGRLFQNVFNVPAFFAITAWILFTVFGMLVIPYKQTLKEVPSYIYFKIFIGTSKRAGRVGTALIPFNIFLTLKPNPLPGVLYLSLLTLHKWISRLAVALVVFHSGYFLQKWLLNKEFAKLITVMNLTGEIVFFLWIIVVIISVKFMRNWSYRTFYFIHTATAWISIPLLYMHIDPEANLLLFSSLGLLIYLVILKIAFSYRGTNFSIKTTDQSQLMLVQMDASQIVEKIPKLLKTKDNFLAGSHVRVSNSLLNYKSWLFATHPYTIASLGNNGTIDLIVKKSRFEFSTFSNYAISLPMPGCDSEFLAAPNKNLTFVCTGSGIAFCLPIYQHHMQNSAILNAAEMTFIWITRSEEDLFVLKELGILVDGPSGLLPTQGYENFQIYVTNSTGTTSNSALATMLLSFLKLKNFFSQFRAKDSSADYHQLENLTSAEADFLVESDTEDSSSFIKLRKPLIKQILGLIDKPLKLSTGNDYLVACGSNSAIGECSLWAFSHNIKLVKESFSI